MGTIKKIKKWNSLSLRDNPRQAGKSEMKLETDMK